VLRIGKCILRALKFLWAYDLAHCDCKPANFFVAVDGNAFLGDYGGVTTFTESPRETTTLFIPLGLNSQQASDELDRWLLTTSLLELSSSTSLNLPLTKAKVIRLINETVDQSLKEIMQQIAI